MALESGFHERTCWTEASYNFRSPKLPPKAKHSKQCIRDLRDPTKPRICVLPCPAAPVESKDPRADSGIVVQNQFLVRSPITTAPNGSEVTAITNDATKQHSAEAPNDDLQAMATHKTFDLRTTDGARDFASWAAQLGPNGFKIQILTLIHWTAWWGFGGNDWSHVKDSTNFTRTADALVASRKARTPQHETCNCSVLGLLSQHDSTFKTAEYRGVQSVADFVNCLHASRSLKTLGDVGALFAKMLNAHSQSLVQQYSMAGDMCRKCDMPMLYLCGSKSSCVSDYDGEVVFSGMGAKKT